jgi:circadian clock protein KaiC
METPNNKKQKKENKTLPPLQKTPTGISGLDELTGGGLPTGRPTLICGEAGSGKTMMSIEFIVRGAMQFDEPGVIMTFEERASELAVNVASLGFDLEKLQADKKIKVDYVHVSRTEIQETGEYDLDGLFVRLDHAISSIEAKRVVLDTIENLFGGLENEGILRAELRRLFTWLKDKGVTAIITGERGEGKLTRHGLEEYVSDCVILLDHRVVNQISTRRMRIVKYRGTLHGTNEYPFLIDTQGITVLPVTALKLDKEVTSDRISTGIPSVDDMLGGKGFFKGSSILVSGTAGTGKSSLAASFVDGACKNKERCLYFAFEEPPQQIIRNMRSINMDLDKHVKAGLLKFCAARPTLYGLEMHLVAMHKEIQNFKPSVVVIDPITNFISIGTLSEVRNMLIRLIDFLQNEQITAMFSALTQNDMINNQTDEAISSLVDTWLTIEDIEMNGERNRAMYIMKSRGMKHSNQVREFVISDDGIELIDVYVGPDGILTGSAREAQMILEETGVAIHNYALSRKDREIVRKRQVLESKIASMNSEFESVEEELNKVYEEEELRKKILSKNRENMQTIRRGNGKNDKSQKAKK